MCYSTNIYDKYNDYCALQQKYNSLFLSQVQNELEMWLPPVPHCCRSITWLLLAAASKWERDLKAEETREMEKLNAKRIDMVRQIIEKKRS